MKRTHHCNQLRLGNAGNIATLSGWVHSCRDLGGVIFLDIRDREGRTQAVFDPQETDPALVQQAAKLHSESVITVRGNVRKRPLDTAKSKIPTGDVEIVVDEMEVHNHAEVLPFQIDDPETAAKVNEERRLQFRYWDLDVLIWRVTYSSAASWQFARVKSWKNRVF